MRPSRILIASALALPMLACSSPSPRRAWAPHGHGDHHAGPASYAMPWAVPVPPAPAAPPGGATPATAAPAGRGWSAERARCLADAASREDCEAALRAAAAAWDATPGAAQAGEGVYDVYRRACELKAKLQGCGVFKSRAVGEADRPNVERLMICEMGRGEACEDVSTKSAPLHAWLSTLRADHCKKGHSALCKSHRECRGGTQWGCRPATEPAGAGEVCGCVPRSCDGAMTVAASPRTWPDGSARGVFTCGAAAPAP